jgi:sugar lactone lactonase YvrE
MNPIDGFFVNKDEIGFIGAGLQRPECILATRDGSLWAADARGGVTRISPDGSQSIIAPRLYSDFIRAESHESRFTSGTLPNGLAFAVNGDIIIANFGTDRLEVMSLQGDVRVLADKIDGMPIGKVNFVLRDTKGRLWITVSTRMQNWMRAISPRVSDGFIALYDGAGLRIVADGLKFANELRFDAAEEWLYVVETCGPHVTRFRVQIDGSCTDREVYGPPDHGALIDGIAFDAHGNLWGTHVFADRIFAITPDRNLRIILDDGDPVAGARLMKAFRSDEMTPELLLDCGGGLAPWFASVTFGGPDLKTLYIGSLRGTRIPYFRAPVSGLPMVHWHDARASEQHR